MYRNTKTETTMLGNPSTRKSRHQSAIGTRFPTLVIIQVQLLANDVSSGVAEIKRPVLKASASRL